MKSPVRSPLPRRWPQRIPRHELNRLQGEYELLCWSLGLNIALMDELLTLSYGTMLISNARRTELRELLGKLDQVRAA